MSRSSMVGVAAAMMTLASLPGCYSIAPADGTVFCSVAEHRCPSGYSCAANDTCWRDGSDAGTGATGCAGLAVTLCEDFESGALDPATWASVQTDGTVTIDNQEVHGGRYAMHAHTNAATAPIDQYARISESRTFPALQDGGYVRVFAFMPSPAPTTTNALIEQDATSGVGVTLNVVDGQFNFYEYGNAPDHTLTSATDMPLDRWACLEWHVSGGATQAWLDGKELGNLDFAGPALGALQRVQIGSYLYQSTNAPPTDLWIDDIIVDSNPIGCAR